jgi:hypothetical protein
VVVFLLALPVGGRTGKEVCDNGDGNATSGLRTIAIMSLANRHGVKSSGGLSLSGSPHWLIVVRSACALLTSAINLIDRALWLARAISSGVCEAQVASILS